jgi:perosamine synthetase
MSKQSEWPSWPKYEEADVNAVTRVIRSNQLFAAEEVREFENTFKKFVNVDYSVAVGNATQGLHLALAALGIGIGDEVIVTSYSWISTASCILMQNAIPIFCDICPDTLHPTLEDIKKCRSSRTKAVIIAHLWGSCCEVDIITDFCKSEGLFLIEDCAHAIGTTWRGRHVGTWGDIGVFSFHQRKALPVGDGGMCISNRNELAEKIYRLRSFGDSELSYNYRMSEFAGSLGVSRLSRVTQENAVRIHNAQYLNRHLCHLDSLVKPLKILDQCLPTFYSYVLLFASAEIAGKALEGFQKVGIPARATWTPLHTRDCFKDNNPARGLPWGAPFVEESYDFYQTCIMEITHCVQMCPDRIIEIDVHPPVNESHLDAIVDVLNHLEA